jgi:hypothetical protein
MMPSNKSLQATRDGRSSVAEAMEDRPVPLRERIALWGHAPLRGSRWLVPLA